MAGQRQTLVIEGWVPQQLANGQHGHWSVRQARLRQASATVWASAKASRLQPVTGRARVEITLVFPVHRRRDTDNLYSRCKGSIDGLVRGGWIRDDSSDWLDLHVQAQVEPGRLATVISLEAL